MTTNELVILLDANSGSGVTVGLLASVHVAYRLNSDGAWTDAAIFAGTEHDGSTTITANSLKANVDSNLTEAEAATYLATYGEAANTTGAMALRISSLKVAKDAIDQIELLIYIDGTDYTNNNQDAISGVGGSISIFFHTTEPAPVTP